MSEKKVLKGGEFLIHETSADQVFTPEDLTEEQKMFASMTEEFLAKEVRPNIEELDSHKDNTLMVQLLDKAGELGLLGAAVPEEYGGLAIDFKTETVLIESMGPSFSFGVAYAAHTGIGTLPILYYGTEEQKQKYLPKIASGESKAAYCLTEPSSGSDALSAKTTAVLSDDGKHYILNGQKMWITNGGFADIFTVFAKIDGEHFTAFIVESGYEGVTRGEEEKKLGIKGSSTCQIFLENVKVPVENLLGENGKGHKIAFNVLNIGRYKLGAMVSGGNKMLIDTALNYALEREQFGKPIAEFGAIGHKLAEMAIRTFAVESMTYRISGLIYEDIERQKAEGVDAILAKLNAAEEYSIECAILKVFGSEMLDFVVDEAVQIYGGMGFSEESPVARPYRDSRINRIFEGTNEINRLLSVGMMLKKAMKGELDLMSPAMAVQKELMSIPSFGSEEEGPLTEVYKVLGNVKKAILMVAGAAVQKYMMKLEEEQEIIMNLADMLIELYTMESMVLRTARRIESGNNADDFIDMTRVWTFDALDRVHHAGKTAIAAFAEGDEARMMQMGLKRFTKTELYNTIAARRRLADKMKEAGNYPW